VNAQGTKEFFKVSKKGVKSSKKKEGEEGKKLTFESYRLNGKKTSVEKKTIFFPPKKKVYPSFGGKSEKKGEEVYIQG